MRKLLTILLVGAAVIATPAMGQQQSTSPTIDRMSEKARAGIGVIYGAAGARACGAACGRVASKVGTEVYDRSRDVSTRYGEKLQDLGRRARERYDQRSR